VFSDRNAPVLFESRKQAGRLFLVPFGLDREHTSWPVQPTFIPFLDLALQAARAEDPTPTVFEPGEIAQVPAPPGVSEMVVRNGTQQLSRVRVEQGKGQVHLPGQPGIYSLTYDQDSEVQRLLSVNPSPKESELLYVDSRDNVGAWQTERALERTRPEPSTARGKPSLTAILQQRWWWWMVVMALVVLILEVGLAEAKRQTV
jgi:hypothetical protein